MSNIVYIIGTNGVGKTSTARALPGECQAAVPCGPSVVSVSRDFVAVGNYRAGSAVSGADTITSSKDIFRTLSAAAVSFPGRAVLSEGMVFTGAFAVFLCGLQEKGHKCFVFLLHTGIGEAVRRVIHRSGKIPGVKRMLSKANQHSNALKNAAALGVKCVRIDTTRRTPEQCAEVIRRIVGV